MDEDALDALADRIVEARERLGAPVVMVRSRPKVGDVEVWLTDLDDPAAIALRAEFAGDPVDWAEGHVGRT